MVEVVKMAINGLEYDLRKEHLNQQFLDLAQLAYKVPNNLGERRKELKKKV